MLYNKRVIKFTAKVMFCTLALQLVYPAVSSALTTGPSQPEVQSFEPVGTTDMVDMFTGDFVYNIPLLDVEGYPVNISYHGGVDMEQEASWVGLGWNINPGVINRTVRGMPDDFNGETISKTLNIKPEKTVRVGLGVGAEPFGVGSPIINLSANASLNLNVSNYRGVSADFSLGAGVNVIGMASAGINMGVGSQSGADVDYNLGLSFNTSQIIGSDVAAGVGFSYGHGYNTRSGLKDKSLQISASVTYKGAGISRGFSATVPIGIKNIIPVVTNSTVMKVYRGQLKLGGELFGVYGHVAVYGMVSALKYNTDGSMPGYGYLYAQNADDHAIQDFTRDRDGMFNPTMSYLPLGNMTYDIYSVAGQGTGGSFRPFRNDFGSVYDPAVSSIGSEFGANLEVGIGNLFSLGGDLTISGTDITSGPWNEFKRPFSHKKSGSLYENTYFKQAGEATAVNEQLFSAIQGTAPISGTQTGAIPLKKPGSDSKRDPRANLITYFTGDEAEQTGVASSKKLYSYNSTDGFASSTTGNRAEIARVGENRKGYHMSEIVQTQTDGRRYIFGLPAMNKQQEEVSFAVNPSSSTNGLTTFTDEASTSNNKGRDNYFSKTSTPAFAHSYLLTSVLSTDYVDISGDGPTDDDFGSFTKFNYTLKNTNFGWKAPYGEGVAQYNPGFKTDTRDDKASYVAGKREQWITHSIESKNFVAEFYTSGRKDALGVVKASDKSFKLDSIRLFNKHDRFINGGSAIPIKTVIFDYDYSLCQNVENNENLGVSGTEGQRGKLTLKKIFVRYGNSDKSMISPYQFSYGHNYDYSISMKDRWGGYKAAATLPNADFPFVNQEDNQLDAYAGAWSLEKITLPSGGNINIEYEADDYAFVQDKVAMEMFIVKGLGNTANYSNGNQLYFDKNSPNRYLYFKRRIASEKPNLTAKENYLKNSDILYYNFDTRLVDNAYEPIKGYADVEEVAYCSDNIHGYVKIKPVAITGGGATLNHVTYTALNFARYYLPHIIFPGSNPDESDLSNVLSGLQYAFSELVSFTKNPVKRMVEEGKAKQVNLTSSYVRLNSPGLKKKGGGQRVKKLVFADNWKKLAGGNTQNADYGKTYDYTTEDQGSYGRISSGVASYEPQIGGDENPFREPVNYSVQSGSKWPPNDPVGVYQELPVGESLYPGAGVGYSRITVRSIHQQEGRSSQGEDIYDFYTAKDFPIQALSTTMTDVENTEDYNFIEQKRIFKAGQGYTLVFNDMHGKPKRTEHRILKPATGESEMVSYQQYIYNTENGKLSNNVPVIVHDPVSGKMKKEVRRVAFEADLTIDTREKIEATNSTTEYLNLNVFLAGFIPIPIPFWYSQDFNFRNEFRSVVATKVVQQYGILKEVQSSQEGALTTVRNEAFDPITGQALITSVNNEFNDKEYSVSYPAYWGYKSMGASYENTGYEEKFATVDVENYAMKIPNISASNYKIGDELFVTYTENGQAKTNNMWVMGIYKNNDSVNREFFKCDFNSTAWRTSIYNSGTKLTQQYLFTDTNWVNSSTSYFSYGGLFPDVEAFSTCGNLVLIAKPRFKSSIPQNGAFSNVRIKVIRSGAKNQLNESLQQYNGMSQPFDGNNFLKDKLDRLISISAKEYSDTLTAILPSYDSLINPIGWDALNIYVNGTRQIKRVSKEYAYIKNREYNSTQTRSAGLFSANSLWNVNTYKDNCFIDTGYCANYTQATSSNTWQSWDTTYVQYLGPVNAYLIATPSSFIGDFRYMSPRPQDDKNWVVARTVTKYSPWGFELENKDAIGNYTAAQYGYNQQLPVALAQNAKQHEVLSENFEDYQMLQVMGNLATVSFSPICSFLNQTSVVGNGYNKYLFPSSSAPLTIVSTVAHSGKYSLATTNYQNMVLKIAQQPEQPGQPRLLPFVLQSGKKYLVSYWFKPKSATNTQTTYTPPNSNWVLKSNIIEGWQQAEYITGVIPNTTTLTLPLPSNAYVDDIRILPVDANMKSFVYHPVNQKLVATLDENNFASFYEYDQEGNLVRTKKETEKGITTVMESRSANAKRAN